MGSAALRRVLVSASVVLALGIPSAGAGLPSSSPQVPDDPLLADLWGLDAIDAPEAWDLNTGSRSVVVAVIDTGVAYGHPDLAPNLWTNDDPPGNGDEDGNGKVDDTHGWDFVQDDATPLDYNGHGTRTAGTIGARGNNGLGVAGVSWDVSLMPLRAGDAAGSFSPAAVAAAIAYACAEGADVVNGSFTMASSDPAIEAAVTSAACAQTLFVFAAGNGSADLELSGAGHDAYPCELHRSPAAGGNAATALASVADGAPPETTISMKPPALTRTARALFRFAANEPATFECSLDGAPFATCSSPLQLTGLATGPHTFRVRAVDAAALTDPTPAEHSWTVDRRKPNTAITAGPPAATASRRAVFRFRSSEPGSRFRCRLDARAWAACASPRTYTALASGRHVLRVRAIDAAGNVDASPATRRWRVR